MRKLVASAIVIGAGLFAVGVAPAGAGQPAVKGCVGASVSSNAVALHPYGTFVREITPRNEFGSLGDAIHALQAGLVPNELYANSCN